MDAAAGSGRWIKEAPMSDDPGYDINVGKILGSCVTI
jgi:hypothetical protein